MLVDRPRPDAEVAGNLLGLLVGGDAREAGAFSRRQGLDAGADHRSGLTTATVVPRLPQSFGMVVTRAMVNGA